MKRKRWLAMAAVVGFAAGATGCADKDVEKYLGKAPNDLSQPGGELYRYLDRLSDAVCQLEEKDPSGLDEQKRICPGGPGDKVKPPTYPP